MSLRILYSIQDTYSNKITYTTVIDELSLLRIPLFEHFSPVDYDFLGCVADSQRLHCTMEHTR